MLSQEEELERCFYNDIYAEESPLVCYGCKFITSKPIHIYPGEPERYYWYCTILGNKQLGTSDYDSPNCIIKSRDCPLLKSQEIH